MKKEKKLKNQIRSDLRWNYVLFCILIFILISSIFCLFWVNFVKSNINNFGLVNAQVVQDKILATNDDNTQKQGAEAIDEARKCVVEISCECFGIKMAGSGVLIGKSSINCDEVYVVTNNHIVQNALFANIRLFDGCEIENVKIIGQDRKNDLAVLMFNAEGFNDKLNFATIRNTQTYPLLLAEEVFAIGNPLGQLGGTLTKGIISSLKREIYVDNNKMELIQTDASINNGNSGGGLFDNFGRLIGIVNAKVSASGVEGLGFAIPIEQVEKSCFALINSHMNQSESEDVEKGMTNQKTSLGFCFDDVIFINKNFDIIKGYFVTKIDANSKAYSSGIKISDKVISLKINGTELELEQGKRISYSKNYLKIGDNIEIEISREPFNESKVINFQL